MNALWWRQIVGILRLEIRKNLFSSRALPLYMMSAIPLVIVTIFIAVTTAFDDIPREFEGPGGATMLFAAIFHLAILRTTLYFACVWVFMNLFRGEVLDRSLHYYFLAPVRRDVLVAGKFLSALVGTLVAFGAVTTICFIALQVHLGAGSAFAASGHLLAYLAIIAMACVGYGAIFMVAGLFMKNPVIPALVVFFWEGVNTLLPALLKKFSVIFYLQSLFPVDISEGPIEIISEPVPLWIGVPGFIVFSGLMLVLAGLQIRRKEIDYGED